ncbi:hypothetical protein G647_09878 [Cladophialophora carrionii CBS 160.54]|uniref:GST N-terminal domain-containing protein n=1 Tax=Cladophialophora carrionii CBS 160.54 TaxID=1279043 RepID=V9DK06_9EURO|nr:uncharacterized protein G647_09878 [Cladophialophora carrionii CBS 160.54]ETI27195.1 hypothetical protein G647_09878 [Cladophialophora carrionii CBS 160.54]
MASQTNGTEGNPYTLYHHYYSLCSIMIRYLLRIRGDPQNAASAMNVTEEVIDIFKEEQLSEKYLLEVNPNGQVPVLGSPVAFSFPLAQTTAISKYIAERYPALHPPEHTDDIKRLLDEMHAMNFFTLSFVKSPKLASGFADAVLKRLANPDISDEYRKALEYKLMILRRDKVHALEPAKMQAEVDKCQKYLNGLVPLLRPDSGPWLWGYQKPTALDADLVVLLARLQDVGRHGIIPQELKEYAEKAYQTPEWIKVMEGRTTMYDGGNSAAPKK